MSSHPFSQWLDLARATLPAIGQAGAGLPAARSQYARYLKSTLAFGKDLGELHGAAGFALLQAQLGMLGAVSAARTAQGLLDLQLDTMSQLHAQWKALADRALARTDACIDDLRQARSHDDASFVMAGVLRDAEAGMRKAGEEAAMLFNSASAAGGVLVHRLLDELIAQPSEGTAPRGTDGDVDTPPQA